MRRLKLGDKILRVRDEPEPTPEPGRSPPPLVLLHGAGGSSVVWVDALRRLANPRRVVAPDLPGHGQSERWPGAISLEGYRDAVFSICTQLGIGRAVLGGHSMGAAIALRCALAAPERVAGLVLLNGAGRLSVPDETLALLDRVLPRATDLNAGPAPADPWIDRMPPELAELSFSPATAPELRARWQAVLLAAPREVVLADFRACRGDVTAQLGELRVPTLVIGGADDLLVPPRRLEQTAAAIPGAELHLLPRTGHFTHLEQSDAALALVTAFLDRIR